MAVMISTTSKSVDELCSLLLRRIVIVFLILFTVSAAVFSGIFFSSMYNLEAVKKLDSYSPPVPSRVLDVKGKLIAEFFTEKREIVSFDLLPPALIDATLATEDEQFFTHYGFNFWRILKAAWLNIKEGRRAQGGSTITIQLAKNLFFSSEKTYKRKIMELWYAVQIEKQYTKKEILLFYFNQINFGHGCYGVKSAAEFLFNKPVEKLSLAECALLAGIPKSPTHFSPIRNQKRAMARHYTVMHSMVRAGFLTPTEARSLYFSFWQEFLQNIRRRQSTITDIQDNKAPYFIEYIRDRLEQMLGRHQLYKGGLIIHTALDSEIQASAQQKLWKTLNIQNNIYDRNMSRVRDVMEQNENEIQFILDIFNIEGIMLDEARYFKTVNRILNTDLKDQMQIISLLTGQDLLYNAVSGLQDAHVNEIDEKAEGSLIAIEPSTGYISAMVGGSGFSYENQFNHVFLAKRQIGSLIKPFIYAPAIDSKIITAASKIRDLPTMYGEDDGEGFYFPQNYSGFYRGKISVREALKKSINICAVDVLHQVGIENARQYGGRFFRVQTIRELIEKFPRDYTMALGSGSFSPFDVCLAFSVLANEGREVIPLTIRFITDSSGEIITNIESTVRNRNRQIIDPATAFIITSILSGVFKPGGTAFHPKLIEKFIHAFFSSGKTGTTSNWTDAWFAGYNRYLTTVVWVGYDNNRSLGRGRVGGQVAAPVWIDFNKEALADKAPLSFQKPNNVLIRKICAQSGYLSTPSCRNTLDEFFISGTEPRKFCDVHAEEYNEVINLYNILKKKKKK